MAKKRTKKPVPKAKSPPERLTIEQDPKTLSWKTIDQGSPEPSEEGRGNGILKRRSGQDAQAEVEPRKRVFVEVLPPKPPSSLRGILPTPPEVAELVAQVEETRPMSDAARQRVTDDFKLQFYFGGHWIAYRLTPEGKEVLAVGREEIRRLRRKPASRSHRENIVYGLIDPW